MDKLKWFTAVEYVDVETGEIITKSEKERNYYVVGNETRTEINNEKKYGIKYIRKNCRRNGQQKLFGAISGHN